MRQPTPDHPSLRVISSNHFRVTACAYFRCHLCFSFFDLLFTNNLSQRNWNCFLYCATLDFSNLVQSRSSMRHNLHIWSFDVKEHLSTTWYCHDYRLSWRWLLIIITILMIIDNHDNIMSCSSAWHQMIKLADNDAY